MLNTVSLQGCFHLRSRFQKDRERVSLAGPFTSRKSKKTVYVPCVAWKELAETINKYFRKSTMCVIIGELINRLVNIKDSAERTQRYTKLEVLVHKIFFVDREGKEEINEPRED